MILYDFLYGLLLLLRPFNLCYWKKIYNQFIHLFIYSFQIKVIDVFTFLKTVVLLFYSVEPFVNIVILYYVKFSFLLNEMKLK